MDYFCCLRLFQSFLVRFHYKEEYSPYNYNFQYVFQNSLLQRPQSIYLSVLQNIMMKTQKTIELQGKTHRKRHFKIKTPKTHSNIENKPRLIHSPIAKEIASMKARNLLRWDKENHCVGRNTKPRYIFSFQVPCAAPAKNQNKTALQVGRTAISKNPLRKNRILFSCFGVWGVFRKQQREVWQLRGVVPGSQLWDNLVSAVEGVGRINFQISVKVFVRPVCCGETRAFYEKILSAKWTYFFMRVKGTAQRIDL